MSKFPKVVWLAICSATLFACGDQQQATDTVAADATDAAQQAQSVSVAAAPEQYELEQLSLPKRVAFMAGHVEAGLALYRAGENDMAAKHFLHPVSETHEAEREGLDAIGFNAELFSEISEAMANGIPAAQVEPQLQAARDNLADMVTRAGGNNVAILDFLMEKVSEEYAAGVSDGAVVEAGEYQDAFGFATVAVQHAADLEQAMQAIVAVRLDALLLSWPTAPVPPAKPVLNSVVQKRVDDVRAAFRISADIDES